jgi:hypothetical protein
VSGSAVAAASRALHPAAPVIGMTGGLPNASEISTYDGMLLKPFTIATLASMVGRFLPGCNQPEGAIGAAPSIRRTSSVCRLMPSFENTVFR